jgi:Tfp pilus assembly protein PilN
MIELNLMPKDMRAFEAKKKKASLDFKIPNIPPTPVIISVIGVIILSQIVLGLVSLLQKRQLSRISNEIAVIAPEQSIAAALKKEVDELSNKFTTIEGLTQGSLVWSKKLSDLSNTMIDGIWLSSLSLNTEMSHNAGQAYGAMPGIAQEPGNRQTLVLTGFAISSSKAEDTAAVGKFIESLKSHNAFFKDFDDIKLSSIQRESYGNTDVMNFTLICYFKPDRSYFEKLQNSVY